jgi:ATP-dependent RNA helicase RhlE
MHKTTVKKRKGPGKPKRDFSGSAKQAKRQKPGRGVSKLDPEMLVKRAMIEEEEVYAPERRIADLPVAKALLSRLADKGYEWPTEIQDKTIEAVLEGKDILGIAQTGTGKTGAFLIPIVDYLLRYPKHYNKALILVPTRELALQVEEEFKSMTKGLKLFSACFIGGTNIGRDLQTLRRPQHVVIGTPGRLLDLYGRNVLNLRHFNTLVLDEFDRMLDMGFSRDMDRIIEAMENRDQTMLFSATIDPAQKNRVADILFNPLTIMVSTGDTSGDHIEQMVVRVGEGEDKFGKLINMLNHENFSRVLIFEETKHRVKRLSQQLNKAGIASGQIQGNMSQVARQKALKAFKDGQTRVLVASDVASRGIDVNNISHVINYQMPMSYDTYIHRIGRTGRAGSQGTAYTFVS